MNESWYLSLTEVKHYSCKYLKFKNRIMIGKHFTESSSLRALVVILVSSLITLIYVGFLYMVYRKRKRFDQKVYFNS
jgi:cytochrome bd-type quinol oxidase subunit 2